MDKMGEREWKKREEEGEGDGKRSGGRNEQE